MKLIHSLYIVIGTLILFLIPSAIDISDLLKHLKDANDYYYRYLFSQLLANIIFLIIIILSILFFIQLVIKILYSSKINININALSLIISGLYLLLTILLIFSFVIFIQDVKVTPLVFMDFFSYFFPYLLFLIFFGNIEMNFIYNKKTLSLISIIVISFSIFLYLIFTTIVNVKYDIFSYMNIFKNGSSVISTLLLYFAYLNFFISLYKLQKKEE